MIKEPWQSVWAIYPGLYKSAMLSGDVENATICRWSYLAAGYWVGTMDISSVLKQLVPCIKEVVSKPQELGS